MSILVRNLNHASGVFGVDRKQKRIDEEAATRTKPVRKCPSTPECDNHTKDGIDDDDEQLKKVGPSHRQDEYVPRSYACKSDDAQQRGKRKRPTFSRCVRPFIAFPVMLVILIHASLA